MVVKPTMLRGGGGKFKMSEILVCFRKHNFVWLGGEAHNAARLKGRSQEVRRLKVPKASALSVWHRGEIHDAVGKRRQVQDE